MTPRDDLEDIGRKGGSALRWAARGLIVGCGLMIGLVALSDPRITGAAREALARSAAEGEVVARRDGSAVFPALTATAPVTEAMIEVADTPHEPARPRVSVLPESRVNVIRLTD